LLDNLQDPDSSQFFQDEDEIKNNIENPVVGFNTDIKINNNRKFLGLKPQQLFILLVMLLLVVCLLGAMFLLVTGKMVPSFL